MNELFLVQESMLHSKVLQKLEQTITIKHEIVLRLGMYMIAKQLCIHN